MGLIPVPLCFAGSGCCISSAFCLHFCGWASGFLEAAFFRPFGPWERAFLAPKPFAGRSSHGYRLGFAHTIMASGAQGQVGAEGGNIITHGVSPVFLSLYHRRAFSDTDLFIGGGNRVEFWRRWRGLQAVSEGAGMPFRQRTQNETRLFIVRVVRVSANPAAFRTGTAVRSPVI
ncbi:hypothetical protein VTK56DRAFT_9497 [Thermocarpiscus australiensis]